MSYIFYKYESSNDGDESGSNDGNESSSLSVVVSDSEAAVQGAVKTYIENILAKSLTTSSHIQTIPVTEDTEATIYYRCVQAADSDVYIVCYLCDDKTQLLSAFYHELDRYTDTIRELILEGKDVQQIKLKLDSWYSECITYVLRVVDYFRSDLAGLLYMALSRNDIQIHSTAVGANSQIHHDTASFISSCSLKELIYNTAVMLRDADSTEDIMIDFDNRICNYNTNKFCRRWAELIEFESDPFRVRQLIEDYKILANQDMNVFRRLLRQAETDHYAFYQAYEFIKQHENGDVILELSVHESTVYSILSTDQLLNILQEFILSKANSNTTCNTHVQS